jgi:hypothetical protein
MFAPLAFALHAGLSIAAAGCTPGEAHSADQALSSAPRWEGRAQEVFDDQIDPAAVALADAVNPRADPLLRERAKTADVVARLRVTTVTVETRGDTTTYHLGVVVIPPAFAEPKLSERSFDLVIGPSGRAYGIAKAFDARLRGATFVGFIQRFASAGGEPAFHFHLCPDTAEVVAAVKDAVALGEMAGS